MLVELGKKAKKAERILCNISSEKKDEALKASSLQFYNLGVKTNVQLIIQIVLTFISLALVITAPFVQAALSKIKFKKVENKNEQ